MRTGRPEIHGRVRPVDESGLGARPYGCLAVGSRSKAAAPGSGARNELSPRLGRADHRHGAGPAVDGLHGASGAIHDLQLARGPVVADDSIRLEEAGERKPLVDLARIRLKDDAI